MNCANSMWSRGFSANVPGCVRLFEAAIFQAQCQSMRTYAHLGRRPLQKCSGDGREEGCVSFAAAAEEMDMGLRLLVSLPGTV